MDYYHFVARLGLGALVAASVIGCAQERDAINKVQANALAKSFFVGEKLSDPSDDPEFYAGSTVVDVPFGASVSVFTGFAGDLRRVKWEISEKVLSARLTYENIQGVDGKGARTTNEGQVIAAFDIESHFDVRRDYNPQTGEELNVVVENTSDRPWYARDYMRVNWSSNKITTAYTFDPLSSLRDDGEQDWLESLTYRVDDPSDPDAPVFDGPGGYFDITNKLYVKPRTIRGMPACYYYAAIVQGGSYPYGACDPVEVKLRLSFLRVAQPGEPGYRDYQPQEWDGARFNAHGAFTRDRLGYDRHYGIVDSKWHHLIQRYNIWDKSHLDLGCSSWEADGDKNGTDDECQQQGAPAGSRCDALVGLCTIPYAQRKTRPNAWHFNLNNADEVAFESTRWAAEEWDTALRLAAQVARRVECQRTKGESVKGTSWEATVAGGTDPAKGCEQAFPVVQTDDAEVESVRQVNRCWAEKGRGNAECAPQNPNSVAAMAPIIALCHSPVQDGDDDMCGAKGLVTRPGDLRYHQVNVVPSPQTASPWGYGPTMSDPLTGEVIQGSINVWNSVTDQTAQLLVDQIRWINGEISADKVTSGDYVQDWARAAAGHVPGSSPLLTSAAIDQRVLGTGATTKQDLAQAATLRRQLDMRKLNQAIVARSTPGSADATAAQPGVGSTAFAEAQARIALAKNTPIEASLMSKPWIDMAAVDPQKLSADDLLNAASPLRALSSETVGAMERKMTAALAEKGQCMVLAPEPNGVIALSKIMKEKFPYDAGAGPGDQADRVNRMWNYLRGKLNYAVIAHEMGHTIGMRHNFASSFDKFNYRPQYWQLRTQSGKVKQPCTGPVADGSTCVGPRYFDPLDQNEIDEMIWMWSQTTVMDYAGDVTQDTLGLGVFDYSAARAFYADTVDVRNDGVTVPPPGRAATTKAEVIGMNMFNELIDTAIQPLAQVFVSEDGQTPVHYSRWNDFFDLLHNCRPADTSPPADWDAVKNGNYSAVFDGHIVRKERCDRPAVDYVDWRDMVSDTSRIQLTNYDPRWVIARRAVDKWNRPRMPYAFTSDEWVEGGLPSAYQHDNGADIYEEIMFHDALYEDRHIFDNFRRGRVNFSLYGAYSRAVQRYHGKIWSLAAQYSFIHDFIFHDIARQNDVPYSLLVSTYEGEGGFLRDFVVASSVAFDHFARVLSRPQPGPHALRNGILYPLDGGSQTDLHDVDIPQGATGIDRDVSLGGRPIQNGFVSSGGYWNVNQVGSYYEKTNAVWNLVAQGMGSGNWTRSEGIDSRWLSTNFTNLYPEGVRQLLGVLLTDDHALYAPRVAARVSGFPDVKADPNNLFFYPAKPLGWASFTSPDGPSICWPAGGLQSCTDASGKLLDGMPAGAPQVSIPVHPELGFEIQKFILLWSYIWLPNSQKNDWIDMFRLYKSGSSFDPSFLPKEMIGWKDPQTGVGYIAKRFGDEVIMGKTYDKGISAKMLQWANALTALAYEPLDAATPYDATGRFVYRTDASGQAVVLKDPKVAPDDQGHVRCDENRYCVQLRDYRGLLDYAIRTSGYMGYAIEPPWCQNGIYGPGCGL